MAHQNESKDHGLYIRGALAENITVVRRPDRDSLLEYLRGQKDWVPNLTKDTHRDTEIPSLFHSGGQNLHSQLAFVYTLSEMQKNKRAVAL